jgi:6-phosphogluconate dehydrogenase
MQLGIVGLGRLCARFRSRDDHGFADRLLSAMRKGFGGRIEAKGP